jgi:hypothetical protein
MFGKRSLTSIEVTRTPEPVVFSNQFGVGYSGKRFVIDFAVVLHTKDVKTMTRTENWGNITLLYRFH